MFVYRFLTIYNAVSAMLWSLILYYTLSDIQVYLDPEASPTLKNENIYISKTYDGFPHKLLVYVQLLNAILELSHAITGLVKSPLSTVVLQFSARLLICLGISYKLPASPGNFHFLSFTSLSLAWSITEIIRYGYYMLKLVGNVPESLLWLRYSAFFLLYPTGLVSESYVVYLSLDSSTSSAYYHFLIFALVSYIPGFLVLYIYMIKQRQKILGKRTTSSKNC